MRTLLCRFVLVSPRVVIHVRAWHFGVDVLFGVIQVPGLDHVEKNDVVVCWLLNVPATS